jgi:hypothetical protein
MPLLQEKTTTRKEKKFDSNETRLGLVAYSIRFMSFSKPTKKKHRHDEARQQQ